MEGFRVAHQAVLLRQTAARQRIGELLHLVEGFGDLAADLDAGEIIFIGTGGIQRPLEVIQQRQQLL